MLVIFEEKNYIVPGLILHQEYLKICVKKGKHLKDIKLENFNSIDTFFRFTKIQYFIYALTWSNSLKNNIARKRISRWLEREN